MGHIHELIDFTVAAYIVHDKKVLLIHHKKLNMWLPVGGHIELNEDTDQALLREIGEECGLREEDMTFIENRPKNTQHSFLLTPQYIDIHDITNDHRHVGLIYFVKSRKPDILYNAEEHNSIKWFSPEDLDNMEILPHVKMLAEEAIKTLN